MEPGQVRRTDVEPVDQLDLKLSKRPAGDHAHVVESQEVLEAIGDELADRGLRGGQCPIEVKGDQTALHFADRGRRRGAEWGWPARRRPWGVITAVHRALRPAADGTCEVDINMVMGSTPMSRGLRFSFDSAAPPGVLAFAIRQRGTRILSQPSGRHCGWLTDASLGRHT